MKSQRKLDPNEVRIFSGSSHPQLAARIAAELDIPLEQTRVTRFSNDNLYIQLGASVRSRSVFIVQTLAPPVNDHLMELLMMLDIARSASAKEVHAIIPYFSFSRSDKKDAPRISITARLVADLLVTAGATHIMTMVLHSPQVHGFFETCDLSDTLVVAPDLGAAKAAALFAKGLGLPIAAGNKERISDSEVVISGLVGRPVQGYQRALIYDDEIATGGSILEISRHLVQQGIREIRVACTHGIFVHQGLEKLAALPEITKIVTTDTVFIPPEKRHPKLLQLSVAPVFAGAIRRNYLKESIGDLFIYSDEEIVGPE
jgi:ribose-phosphate pyrophosphokinase